MFSKTTTNQSTNSFSAQTDRLKKALCECESVVIGAGAGLSTSAGFTYSGKRFTDNFSDFESACGFHDMYSGGFYPYDSLEEYWGYWSRYIYLNRYSPIPSQVYDNLLGLVGKKDYFVITTNVDHAFQKSGFDKSRLFYTQGDYGLFQCSEPCCNKTVDNEEIVREMVKLQKDRKIPSDLIPICPDCGKPMTMNLRADDKFVQDEGWEKAAKQYSEYLEGHRNSNILFLELGVGYNTPVIIKYPFWRMTKANKNAVYACINFGEAECPEEIRDRAVVINGDIGKVIGEIM